MFILQPSTIFRRILNIPKIDYQLSHVCLPVGMEQLGCHWWTDLSVFKTICPENASLIET
jgi:hypothetical protein